MWFNSNEASQFCTILFPRKQFLAKGLHQKDWIGVAPADCWNWCEWGFKEYEWKVALLSWFVGLVMPVPVLLQLIFSSPNTTTIHFFPSPSKLVRQTCWVACLLVCVYGLNQKTEVCCNHAQKIEEYFRIGLFVYCIAKFQLCLLYTDLHNMYCCG